MAKVVLTKLREFVNSRKPNESVVFHIPILTIDDVFKLINSLSSNVAVGLDGINTRLLKFTAPAVVQSLTKLLNSSIKSGICPAQLKQARVTAIHKQGSKLELDNYRPISVLLVISKVLERHVCSHLIAYISNYNLIYGNQAGFCSFHTCESILVDDQ